MLQQYYNTAVISDFESNIACVLAHNQCREFDDDNSVVENGRQMRADRKHIAQKRLTTTKRKKTF